MTPLKASILIAVGIAALFAGSWFLALDKFVLAFFAYAIAIVNLIPICFEIVVLEWKIREHQKKWEDAR